MVLKFFNRDSTAPHSAPSLSPSPFQSDPQHPRRFSLQGVLIVPFLLQISLAVGLTGYLSLRNGQEAVSALAEDLMQQTKASVNQHLDDYLKTPYQINQINTHLIQQGSLEPQNFEQLSQHFWNQAKTYPEVSYIGFGLPTGEYVGAGDWYDEPGIEIDRTFADSTHYTYSVDAQGRPVEIIDRWNYYPTQEEWYTETATAGKPCWVLAFEDVAEGVYIAATANSPVYGDTGNLIGVLGVDLRIADISQFLETLKPTAASAVFIVDQDGTLIATSNAKSGGVAASPDAEDAANETSEPPDPGAAETEDSDVAPPERHARSVEESELSPADVQASQRPNILESQDPVIQSIAQALYGSDPEGDRRVPSSTLIEGTGQLIEIEGDRHYMQMSRWQDDFGLNWQVIVAVPESDIMAQIDNNLRNTLLLCGLALLGASGLGVLTCRWIARPILQLNQAARAIATGQRNQPVPAANIRELAALSESFNRMADQVETSINRYAQDNETLEERVKRRTQELTQALEELRQTQGQLVHNEKMSSLGQLVAGIAHELNNPINFIYGNLPYASAYVEQLLNLLNQYQADYPHPTPAVQQLTEDIDFDFLQADLPRLLNSLNVGAKRIQEIIRSLRSFSRVDESSFKTVDIHDGIESTLMILSSRIKPQPHRDAIQIVRHYGDIPKFACSPGQLNQVVMNILSNAIDALETALDQAPTLKPTITISTYLDQVRRSSGFLVRASSTQTDSILNADPRKEDLAPDRRENEAGAMTPQLSSFQHLAEEAGQTSQAGCSTACTAAQAELCGDACTEYELGYVTIAIADNGTGIPEAVHRRIFDPFFTTKPIGEGTGLGLSISYKIITEKHQGMLTCHSTPGRGTEFRITLPIRPEPDTDPG